MYYYQYILYIKCIQKYQLAILYSTTYFTTFTIIIYILLLILHIYYDYYNYQLNHSISLGSTHAYLGEAGSYYVLRTTPLNEDSQLLEATTLNLTLLATRSAWSKLQCLQLEYVIQLDTLVNQVDIRYNRQVLGSNILRQLHIVVRTATK